MNNQHTWRTVLSRYIFALMTTGLAFVVSVLIYPAIQHIPSVLFFCAVMLSAWYGGVGAGLLTSILSLFTLDYYFINPIYQWSVTPEALLMAITMALLSVISVRMRHGLVVQPQPLPAHPRETTHRLFQPIRLSVQREHQPRHLNTCLNPQITISHR
jgi:K+-sensing histidine kinase KdpD